MAANKRTKKQIEGDRLFIAQQFLKNYTVREIADNLNQRNQELGYNYTLVHSMIAYDIKKILEDWRDERKEYIDLLIERDLHKLEIIENECWRAWERSKEDKRKMTIRGGSIENGRVNGGQLATRESEESNGDVRYLDKIFECMRQRKELLGYGAAQKVEHSGSVNIGVKPMQRDEISKERERIMKNWKMKAV